MQTLNIAIVCVQNVLRVLEYKFKDVDTTAWRLYRWTPGGNVPTLRSWSDFSCSTSQIWQWYKQSFP